MPRRLRNLIDTGQAAADNANAVLSNADATLVEVDAIVDKVTAILDAVIAQGEVEGELTFLPNIMKVPIHVGWKIKIPQPKDNPPQA